MRMLKATAAGLVVGIIFVEAVTSGLSVLLPASMIRIDPLPGIAAALPWPLWPAPAATWVLGGSMAGAMATALGGRSACGVLTGALLSLPVVANVGWVTPGNPMMLLAALLPLSGAAAGTALALRLRDEDAAVSVNKQAV